MLSQYLRKEGRVKHMAINACLTPVCAMHGLAVTTVEGIGTTQDKLHPVQERIAKSHGSQCGFCTPGIVMSMYALLRSRNKIEYHDIETALQGNLCRCTGYRPILEGFKTFIEGWEKHYVPVEQGSCIMGKECCRNKKATKLDEIESDKSKFIPYDPTQEPIFPPELKLHNYYDESFLFIRGPNVIWIRPRNVKELLSIKHKYPTSKIVVGNTEIGVEMKFKKIVYPILLSPSTICDMMSCKVSDQGIIIGAATSLTDLQNFLEQDIKVDSNMTKVFSAIKRMLHWFAGNQVRNVASLAGNIITASPISDLNPILMASAAVLNVCSLERGYRKVTINENFFKSYRKTALNDDEIVVSIEIPFTESMQFFKAYKQARRRDDDISIVTAAFNIKFDQTNAIVSEAFMCFGGMGPTTFYAKRSSNLLVGQTWKENVISDVCDSLMEELHLESNAPGGMAEYRKSLCLSLFFRFYLYVSQKITKFNGFKINNYDLSGIDEIPLMEPNSSQCYEMKNNAEKPDAVGKPLPHLSAFKQATGEAIYCDDILPVEGELHLSLILSSESHAKIVSIDPSKALALPGVVAFFSAQDLSEQCNKMGPILKDEEVFSRDKVISQACVIGAIVAKSEMVSKRAKNLVTVTYERLDPVIITTEDAIEHKSYFSGYPQQIKKGDVENAFLKSKHVVEGKIRIGAQEHFYLETISAYAIRKEDELEIISTTQAPAEIGHTVAQCLQIRNHKVISKVKRIGGGFGGKETRASVLAVPVAIAAYKLKKPVRSVLDRDEDMQITGYRHPFLIKYKASFNEEGRITGVLYDLYANAGYSMDISCSMIDRTIFHVDNSYFIQNIEVNGYLCKTNMPSNTAFRGFGAPQAMLAAETMIRHIASVINKSYEEIVEINLYREGHLTHFNQVLSHCTLSKCWNQCIETSGYLKRKKSVEEFNRSNRWKKKGISLVPTKYGISFGSDFLMQAGALILVYADGSVLLSIGGIEMGQGLYTKMIQVASKALEIDYTKIYINETATDKVPNASPTAASISSDLYGMAVINACNILKKRISSYKEKNPSGSWEDWISCAYMDRVSLFATGFYAAPKIEYNREKNSGNLYEYFTYGVACSEVIIDCLTGDHQVLRSDIVMDVGESLNPAIDIGQIEGAFMQGYGLFTIEEMVFSPRGDILSKGPGAYKIPAFSDIPKVFNVSLLKGAPNPRAVYSSKAVGEPPLFLAASIYFAIKEAIKSARIDSGVHPEFELDTPATCARIRMACEDTITKQVKPTIKSNAVPWNVVA
ncbi:hypothetical protein O3G_MSEX003913 [Manduca sexta]|nr:hypothetical protein O3G_MSEX003913 [Manduca sexta]